MIAIKEKRRSMVGQTLAIAFVIVYAIPLYVALVNAFKPYADIVQSPLSLPFHFTLDGFVKAWEKANILGLYGNSILITGLSLLVLVPTAAMAAYIVTRKQSKFYRFLYIFLLLGLMVPAQMLVIPSIQTLKVFGLLKTHAGMVLFNAAVYMSVSFFLYAEFFKTLPHSLEEAAIIDGANRFTVFSKILFPLLKPTTATVVIFSGMWIWNDFLPPLYILDDKTGSTITTGIYRAIGRYTTDWDIVFAAVLLASIPMLIVYICLQKQFVKGMAAGAIKG